MDPSEKFVVVFGDQPAPGPIQYVVSPPGLVADQAVRAAQIGLNWAMKLARTDPARDAISTCG